MKPIVAARLRAGIAGLFAALALLALFVARSDAKLETVEPVVPGVWFRQGDNINLWHCNNIIIEMKEYLIVVDANFPSGAKAVMADVKKLSSKPVKWVFDTHHHPDHAFGNSLWTEAGATTLAYKGVVDEMQRTGKEMWALMAKLRPDVRELNRTEPELPRQTFDQSPFVISDGTRRVEFYFFGWAHTRGDAFVYLPKEQVLCTGDVVANGPFNATKDANVGNWPNVLRQAQKLKAKYVLPGHGVAGGKELMEGQVQFMLALHHAVQEAVDRGKKLEDIVRIEGGKPVSTSIQFPDNVKNWVGNKAPEQVRDTYEEIRRGKSSGS